MPKVRKNTNKTAQIRDRVRIFRGVQSILRNERNVNNSNAHQDIFDDSSSSVNFVKYERQKSLPDRLRTWALEFHLTQRAVSSLLKILKSFGMHFLPKDCRTLMRTPQWIQIEKTAGGKFWYNGIRNAFGAIFSKLSSNLSIEMNINADGLPLFKSSPIELWPILAVINGK